MRFAKIGVISGTVCRITATDTDPVTVFGVLFWFCWMWLVAVVGRCLAGCTHYEGLRFIFCSRCTVIGT